MIRLTFSSFLLLITFLAGKAFNKTFMNFAIGGISGMFSTTIVQPIDIVKVRLQVRGEAGHSNLSPFSVARELKAKVGLKGFYKGLDSALVRQSTYTTTRFGVYLTLTQQMKNSLPEGQTSISFYQR